MYVNRAKRALGGVARRDTSPKKIFDFRSEIVFGAVLG